MSDKNSLEVIAVAQINAFTFKTSSTASIGTGPAGIEFVNNVGFKTASRSELGIYVLELKRSQDPKNLVVSVTRNNPQSGNIQAFLLDKDRIQVSNFTDQGSGATPADSPFFIVVWRNRADD